MHKYVRRHRGSHFLYSHNPMGRISNKSLTFLLFGFRYEGPIDRETPHFMKNGSILKNFKMECVSTKMDLDFFVLSVEEDNETKKHKMEIARAKGGIPVCCKCRYDK